MITSDLFTPLSDCCMDTGFYLWLDIQDRIQDLLNLRERNSL
jgi:hypothetical protein